MATPIAGPSHNMQQPVIFPPPTAELKRRAEQEAEAARRLKNPRPPLPPPHILETLVPNSEAFNELLKIEQKLDWTLLRKKAEINDALGRSTRVKRTLRVFLSNTVHNQPWQVEGSGTERDEDAGPSFAPPSDEPTANSEATNETSLEVKAEIGLESKPKPTVDDRRNDIDVNTGNGVAGWVFRIEGRLLDTGNHRLDKQRHKFTSFLRQALVEFDNREAPTFPEGNVVEWLSQPNQQPLDGFEILRRGDKNIKCRIVLHVAHSPERFKVLSPLADLVAIREGTRAEVMTAMWQLVKVAGAQDKEDGTIVRPVGGLEKIMPHAAEGIAFHQIPEVVSRFLTHPDPIVIPYEIRVDKEYNFHPICFDIPIEIEDPLKSKMAQLVAGFEGQAGSEIVKLEDKVAELAYFARHQKQKSDFYDSFAANPQAAMHNWLSAQARDLDTMLGYQIGVPGINGGSVKEEDLRRTDLFQLPWVDEAINVHEAQRSRYR